MMTYYYCSMRNVWMQNEWVDENMQKSSRKYMSQASMLQHKLQYKTHTDKQFSPVKPYSKICTSMNLAWSHVY